MKLWVCFITHRGIYFAGKDHNLIGNGQMNQPFPICSSVLMPLSLSRPHTPVKCLNKGFQGVTQSTLLLPCSLEVHSSYVDSLCSALMSVYAGSFLSNNLKTLMSVLSDFCVTQNRIQSELFNFFMPDNESNQR